MKKIIIGFLLFVGTTNFSNAQLLNSIDKFRFMEGIWKGNGWILNGREKQFFKETETVTTKLSGTIIQMEAFGTDMNDTTKIINDALGLLVLNNEKAQLHIYQSDGSFSIAEIKLIANNEMEWSLKVSDFLKVKYVIKVEGNKWSESGFKTNDGGLSWKQTFEMMLLKI